MKKVLMLIVCAVVATGAFAQDKFSWGVKAGLNLSSIAGKDVNGAKMKAGFAAGVVTEFRLTDGFAIGPELMFSQQGYGVKGESEKLNLSYLNLPIMAKFYVTEKLSINVGPQVGFVLGAKAVDGSNKETLPKELYNKFDVALGAGLTYNFGKVFVDARYNYSLTKFYKSAKNHNSVIQIGVGYKF